MLPVAIERYDSFMRNFDPFGQLERFLPEKQLHRLIRLGAVALYAYLFAVRVMQYSAFFLKPLWVVETLVYMVLAIAFFVRTDPVERSRGMNEVIIPLVGSLLPFALLYTQPSPWVVKNRTLLLVVFCWMTVSTALTAWGMWTLRRAFSITVEARSLVTTGPYRFIRHPIYLGEILSAGAVAFWRFSAMNCLVFLLFVCIQLARARWEEGKLERNFPGYKGYADRTWWPIRKRS